MQIRSLLIDAAVGALAAVAVGCATTAHPLSQSNLARLAKLENLPGKSACFWRSNFQRDWTVLNDSTLIVHAPLPKDAYVIKLFEPVFNLSFRQGLGRCARCTRRRFEQPFYLLTTLMISWNSGLMAGVDMRHVGHFCVLAASCFVLAATALVLYLMVGSWLP